MPDLTAGLRANTVCVLAVLVCYQESSSIVQYHNDTAINKIQSKKLEKIKNKKLEKMKNKQNPEFETPFMEL